MTAEEYKQQHPEHSHLEGDALWNAMENALLKQQIGDQIINKTKPWYKRYKLRYLWYIHKRNGIWVKDKESSTRCISCKKGVSTKMVIMDLSEGGKCYSNCPHCREELIEEPNINLSYKLLQMKRKLIACIWWVLEATHLFRYDISGRYDMFGDESHYVKTWTLYHDDPKGKVNYMLRDRKWWEYIWIERK